MDVVPDANVFIADPWLRSQRWRVLLNYLARTRSRLVLLPSVENEVAAHLRRLALQHASAIDSAIRHAARHDLEGLPAFNATDAAERTFAKWQTSFAAALRGITVARPALNGAILPEALRRATERVPPCDPSGKELRDTILWLSLLDYCRALPQDVTTAFVSLNTKDFASSDDRVLKPELAADIGQLERTVWFFSSLEGFNKAHADRVAYLTIDWVRDNVREGAIERLVASQISAGEPDAYLAVASSEYDDYYEPGKTGEIHSVSVDLTDVYVWRTLPNELELGIEFEVDVEADVDCTLAHRPSRFWQRTYNDDFDEEFPYAKTLTCYGQLSGVVAARIVDDEGIDLIDVEELCRR